MKITADNYEEVNLEIARFHGCTDACPDYISDLNAIWLVEIMLDDLEAAYGFHLRSILRRDMGPVNWDGGSEDWRSAKFAMASPRQKAEAIIETIRKA